MNQNNVGSCDFLIYKKSTDGKTRIKRQMLEFYRTSDVGSDVEF